MRILHKSKRAPAPLPQVMDLISKLADTPNDDLHEVLSEIDSWKWPRSDLNAWIKVLNKFDAILEEVIRDYDIDNLQVNVLTPLTKKTVCEILRFERLLLENSTNRKTFSSYDRLNSLMFTSDLDVLILALNLLLRPAQQYSAQPAVSHALSISTPRLTSLAKRWPNLRDYDINLVDLVGDKGNVQIEALPNEARDVNFAFYRQPPAAAASSKEKERMRSEKFELLARIRAAQALTSSHFADREKLVIVRLLSSAIFGHTHTESQAQSTLFMYEPDLITHVAELLQLDRGVDVQVQTAAIAVLDALGRYRNKMQDVLTAVNAGVNHGILMALLRKTIAEVAQPTSTLPQAFVEALLSFMTFVATHATGGNMVVGAGLVPVLIQVIENRLPNRLYVVSKTMQLVDNVLYGFNNAFQLFCNGRGIEILVDRIEYEVDLDLQECASEPPVPDVLVSYGKLSVARAAVLKHTLRSIHRMMQSSGTSEGLRGLLDSSLLKSVKKIMQNRNVFGPNVLAMAINIMATFVHNEPTCLPVLQEAGLPEAFYSIVETGLEPVIEVIQSVPNAIGALCLNQAGQDQLSARPSIVPSLFSVFTSERHQRVLQEKENAVIIGTSMEELIRHHPSLKDSVFAAIKATMGQIEELGSSFVIPDDLKHWYKLIPPTPTPSSLPAAGETVADVVMEPSEREVSDQDSGAESNSDIPRDSSAARSHDNSIISFIDVFGKFLEGFFQHIPHCKEFVADADALDRLGKLTSLPCLPYDFVNSVASDSLVQVIRSMAEASTGETLTFLLKLVNESLAECKDFWESMDEHSKLLPMVDVTEGEPEAEANSRFRKLITLHIRTSLLSDIYATAGYSHGRATIMLLQSLVSRSTPTILADLGALHRSCVWENIVLKAGLSSQGVGAPPGPTDLDSLEMLEDSSPTPMVPQQDSESPSAGATNGVQADSTAPTPARKEPVKEDHPRERNARALKHLASQIPTSLAPFFQAVVRLFQSRRSTDSTQKQKIRETAGILADILVKHLEQKAFEDKLSLFAYYTVMLGLSTILLVDERSTQKTLHTILLLAFTRIGGLNSIFGRCRDFISTIDMVTQIDAEERSEITKQELVHAYGGLKVALHLLHPMVSVKPLFESGQTALAMTTDNKDTDPEYFEPHNFLVKVRLAALPLLRDLWEAPWLVSAPLSVSKSVVLIVMEVLKVEGEEAKESTASSSMATAGIPAPV
ncbi:E3 ubiquitin-protein ligase ptr1 [Grifola frondosa]|uniref:E3 ubiquitin-protein ligase ptr1 n=1 Tax=Grifola frondosa TaxID=5627 RepID=A0A1C7LQZ9_GRIFR|nr:E3 ubiquitin-protein ligase ptr1 [Grifola frondosa]